MAEDNGVVRLLAASPVRGAEKGAFTRIVPATFNSYFGAIANAGGALIGLLFVAMSINPERVSGAAHPMRRRLASSTFTALAYGFFISIAALVPGANVGYVTLLMSLIGVVSNAESAWHEVRDQHADRVSRPRRLTLLWILVIVSLSVGLYTYEAVLAVLLIIHPHDVAFVGDLTTVLMAIYGIGLTRAWQLLGAPRSVLGWLDPAQHLADDEPRPTAVASPNTSDQTPDAGAAEKDTGEWPLCDGAT